MPDPSHSDLAASPRKPAIVVPEPLFYIGFGALILLLASLPQIFGALTTPQGKHFLGFPYNADDNAVYLSWMRQAQEGNFFLRNRFTTEPQKGVLFNLFFWVLGTISRVTSLHPIAVYQGARVVCGGLFVWAVAHLVYTCFPESRRVRQAAFAFAVAGAGIGWFWQDYSAERGIQQPVDLWQPEAVPFLSLYTMPLFMAGLACMAWFMASFVRAERSGKFRDLLPALLTGFLLGNFHSYDVIPLFVAVLVFRALTDILTRSFDLSGWIRVVLIGVAMLPTTAYQAYALRTETVFFERAFVSNTLSPSVIWVFAGFGLPLLLAVGEALRRGRSLRDDSILRLLVVWAVTGIAVAYIPVSFQRKMLMGAFLPVALLAGSALNALAARLSGDYPKILLGFGVLLAMPSNGLFLLRDVERLRQNVGSTEHRPYLTDSETAALDFLKTNGTASDIVLCAPDPTSHRRFPAFPLRPYLSIWIPAFTSCTVYNGHWSETARYIEKHNNAIDFFSSARSDTDRAQFLRKNNIRYVLVPNALGAESLKDGAGTIFYTSVGWPQRNPPGFLTVAFQNDTVTIYKAQFDAASR